MPSNHLPGALRAVSIAAIISIVLALPTAIAAQAQPGMAPAAQARVEQVLDSFSQARWIGQVAISPDGARLAWVEGGRGGEHINVAPFGQIDAAQTITAEGGGNGCDENSVTWAPDSRAGVSLGLQFGRPGQSVSVAYG